MVGKHTTLETTPVFRGNSVLFQASKRTLEEKVDCGHTGFANTKSTNFPSNFPQIFHKFAHGNALLCPPTHFSAPAALRIQRCPAAVDVLGKHI